MRLHVNGKDIEKQKIYIGFEGEKNYTEIEFDFSDVFSEYPEASAYMNIKPYKGEIYPHTLTREGTNLLVWNVNEADCTVPGVGMYQITFTYNNTVIKSFKGICVVRDSIIGSADPPTPVEEWIADASAALAALENITASAENLPEGSEATAEIRTVNGHKDIHIGVPAGEKGDQGFSPVVTVTDVPGGHQVVIEDESGEHTFTVMNGEDGDDGVSPQVTVTNITGGHRVSVTDASGTDTFDVMDGQDGQDGVTPDFSIGTVQTLPAGSDATASVTGTAVNPVLNLGIPQGEQGDPGEIPQETLDQIEQDISDLNSALKDKADVIVSSASGAIASFPDGAESTAKELVVGIEPVQDLHGQDSPYPPGGGKNKYDLGKETQTINGITFTRNSDGSYKATGTASASASLIGNDVSLPAGEYICSALTNGTNDINASVYVDGTWKASIRTSAYTLTLTETSNVRFVLYVASGQTPNVTFYPMICISSASNPTTYAPYSNICPISGWSGANVQRMGKNLLKLVESEMVSVGWNRIFPLTLKAGTYTMSCQSKLYIGGVEKSCKPAIVRADNSVIKDILPSYGYGDVYMSFTFTITESEALQMTGIFFQPTANGSTFAEYNAMQNMIELGSTATAYEPYSGTSLSISFPSSAGTVYGGSLTVNEDGSGKLVVDRASVDLGSLQWGLTSAGSFGTTVTGIKTGGALPDNAICDCYPIVSNGYNGAHGSEDKVLWQYAGTDGIRVRDSAYSTNEQIKTGLSGRYLCYTLATPIEYLLTNLEVLELLKGVNNVWADTGNTSVTYRADTKLFIEKKISELVAQIVNS